VAVYTNGKRGYRRADNIQMGDFLCRVVDVAITVDPVVAIRTLEESVPAIFIEVPAVSLISEEGILMRPS